MQDIEATIDLYFKGSYEADASKLKRAFHPSAHITGNFKTEIVDWSLEQFIARLQSRPSAAEAGEVYGAPSKAHKCQSVRCRPT